MVRLTRETSERTMMPRMKKPEIAMPSGLAMTLAPSAYSRIRVRTVKPTAAPRRLLRAAEMLTATAPETIMARMPVAYAPAWALTSALKPMVIRMLMAVYTRTTGRTARDQSGAIP